MIAPVIRKVVRGPGGEEDPCGPLHHVGCWLHHTGHQNWPGPTTPAKPPVTISQGSDKYHKGTSHCTHFRFTRNPAILVARERWMNFFPL